MKKLLMSALGAAVLLASASAQAATVIKVATIAPAGTPWVTHLEKWKKAAADASGGDIDIQIFPSGQLGNEYEAFKQVQRGRLDAAGFSGAVMSDNVPELALMSTPFLFDKTSTIDCIYDGKLGGEFAQLVEAKGMHFLQWQETGWVYVYAKDDLSDVANAQDYKVRVAPNPMSRVLWSAVGANGAEIPYTETPAALQTGLVRGGESAAISYLAFGLNKVAPHFMTTAHFHQAGALAISKKRWSSLSSKQRQILQDALPPVQGMRNTLRAVSQAMLGKYKKAGGPLHELTEPQRAAWKAKVELHWPEFVKSLGGKADDWWAQVLGAKRVCEAK